MTVEASSSWLYLGPLTVLCALFAVMLINLVQQPATKVQRALSMRTVVFIGKISYSIYLWNVSDSSSPAGPAWARGCRCARALPRGRRGCRVLPAY